MAGLVAALAIQASGSRTEESRPTLAAPPEPERPKGAPFMKTLGVAEDAAMPLVDLERYGEALAIYKESREKDVAGWNAVDTKAYQREMDKHVKAIEIKARKQWEALDDRAQTMLVAHDNEGAAALYRRVIETWGIPTYVNQARLDLERIAERRR